jgi:hypothetical protein
MNLPTELKISVQTAILLAALVCSLAYLFSHDFIFRPPASRSRQGSKLMQSEKTESDMQEVGVSTGPKPRRLQAGELE